MRGRVCTDLGVRIANAMMLKLLMNAWTCVDEYRFRVANALLLFLGYRYLLPPSYLAPFALW